MAPSLDALEPRQLLNASPVHVHAELLHHHRTAGVEKARNVHHAPATVSAAAATPATSNSFNVVAQFNNASFAATTTIDDNDIWAVGTTNKDTSSDTPLAVHFDGTSWSAVPTLTLKGRADFEGVAAVASNDVWAVGAKDLSSTGSAKPLIEHWNGTSWSVISSPKLSQGGRAAGSHGHLDEQRLGRRIVRQPLGRPSRALGRHEPERCLQSRLQWHRGHSLRHLGRSQ
jgi:hypothetical protein